MEAVIILLPYQRFQFSFSTVAGGGGGGSFGRAGCAAAGCSTASGAASFMCCCQCNLQSSDQKLTRFCNVLKYM